MSAFLAEDNITVCSLYTEHVAEWSCSLVAKNTWFLYYFVLKNYPFITKPVLFKTLQCVEWALFNVAALAESALLQTSQQRYISTIFTSTVYSYPAVRLMLSFCYEHFCLWLSRNNLMCAGQGLTSLPSPLPALPNVSPSKVRLHLARNKIQVHSSQTFGAFFGPNFWRKIF
jgi:hypothetical protein